MIERGVLFDTVAELYDRSRPSYPPETFDDLVALTRLPDGARVLEIGCGTGKATVSMAERGFEVVGVELGESMARVARRNTARFPAVRIHTVPFESFEYDDASFDLVLSATAFHWIDPATRLERCARAMRDGGWLALMDTAHVAGGSRAFFDAAQDCYRRFDPSTPTDQRGVLVEPETIDDRNVEIERSALFDDPVFRRYVWERTCSTSEYIDLLGTYSSVLALEPGARESLLGCIASILDVDFGGSISKRYFTRLTLARRAFRPGSAT